MRNWLMIGMVLLPAGLCGQAQFTLGFLPKITISHPISDAWKATVQIESMQQGWKRDNAGDVKADYQYIRTDLTGVVAYRLNPLLSAAGGYLFRITEGNPVHRTLQQIALVQPLSRLRLGHRFRTDQTFSPEESPAFRLRYRFSAEQPLQGETLNEREWYLLASAEQLGSFQASEWDWEQRLGASLGHYFSREHKLEAGLDYRLDRFLNDSGRHRIWWTFSYFVNL